MYLNIAIVDRGMNIEGNVKKALGFKRLFARKDYTS